jgi:ATP-binding protein involved in chromosome partitioning
MVNQSIKPEDVLKVLATVQEPELHKDLVTLNMIKDVKVDHNDVSFTIVLTTPACPLRAQIEQETRKAVAAIQGVGSINIKWDSSVPANQQKQKTIQLSVRNVIAIGSGKGGVGKSTVAVNIAAALAQKGAKVGLMDADIYGPNIPTMMGVAGLPAVTNGKIPPAVAYGVKMVSIGFMVKPGQPLVWRGPMLHSAIQQFLGDVEWGDLDYLIIDLPPGTGDVQISLCQSITLTGAVIVTLPQKVSLEDASRALEMFRMMNVPILGVVENMSYLTLPDGTRVQMFGEGGGATLATMADVPLLGTIPMESAVREGGDTGIPVVIGHPESTTGQALIALAEAVAARVSVVSLKEPSAS